MAPEKSEGRAPFAIRYSAMGLLPVCEAEPKGVSQPPKAQSQAGLASEGRASTNSLTRLRLKCETVTISRTISGGCEGKTSATDTCCPSLVEPSKLSRLFDILIAFKGSMAAANRKRPRREQMLIMGRSFHRQNLPHRCSMQMNSRLPRLRKMLNRM